MGQEGKIWFVTGASSGFGRALAEEALTRGERVVATARDSAAVETLRGRAPDRIIVEPGAFRTELFGSRFVSLPAMPEYAATVSRTRAFVAGAAGSQPGDPIKAAKAIVDAVAAGVPNLRLPLGADAVTAIREKLARVGTDVDATESAAWRRRSTEPLTEHWMRRRLDTVARRLFRFGGPFFLQGSPNTKLQHPTIVGRAHGVRDRHRSAAHLAGRCGHRIRKLRDGSIDLQGVARDGDKAELIELAAGQDVDVLSVHELNRTVGGKRWVDRACVHDGNG